MRPITHRENSPPQNNRMIVLPKCTWSIMQDRPQNKSQQILKDWNHEKHLFQLQWNEAVNQKQKKTGTFTNMQKLKNILLKPKWPKVKSQRK